ncbi:unnamed protein product [Peronospora belbahrii]|uniref:Uncharacterized protein n=1 Tax=Peronospora belbahrii TaxID=622444 RepID=A0AAU9LK64_9STRA|nr:unnamed protein product [Peronospora belbahrii]
MDTDRKRVLELAEQGDWDKMRLLVAFNSTLAQARDNFGMLPLHWACTEPSVDLSIISMLTHAFPEACKLANLSGMLPLHVAIQTKAPGLLISALLDVYPQAAYAKDGNGRYPVDMAITNNLPSYTINLIRNAALQALQSASKLQMLSMNGRMSGVDSSEIN